MVRRYSDAQKGLGDFEERCSEAFSSEFASRRTALSQSVSLLPIAWGDRCPQELQRDALQWVLGQGAEDKKTFYGEEVAAYQYIGFEWVEDHVVQFEDSKV